MDMSTVKNLAIAIVLIGAVCLTYVNRGRLKKFLFRNSRESINGNPQTVNALKEVCQSFIMFADNFQGIYEPMFKASMGEISFERKKNVLIEWDIRINNIGKLPITLKGWWSTIIANLSSLPDDELQKRAILVIDMIKSCNIIRDKRTDLAVDETTLLYYQRSDGGALVIGQNVHVETPCWYLDSTPVRILEKGYCVSL